MFEGKVGDFAAARGALDEAFFDEVGLVDLLDGAGVFADGGGYGGEAHRTSAELVDDGRQYLIVNFIEAVAVDVEGFEGEACYLRVDVAVAFHLGEVANAAQKCVGYTGRASRAHGYLVGGFGRHLHMHQRRRAPQDAFEHHMVVVFEVALDAEAGTQRSRQQTAASGGAHKGEGVQSELHRARSGAFVYHDVDAVVLHGRVEIFLHHGTQAVDFVDEEHIVFFEGGEDAGKVAGLVEHRSGGGLHAHSQLVGDDAREGCLAQTGRTEEQYVVERFAAHACRLDEYLEVGHYLVLTVECLETAGTQCAFELFVALVAAYVKVLFHNESESWI